MIGYITPVCLSGLWWPQPRKADQMFFKFRWHFSAIMNVSWILWRCRGKENFKTNYLSIKFCNLTVVAAVTKIIIVNDISQNDAHANKTSVHVCHYISRSMMKGIDLCGGPENKRAMALLKTLNTTLGWVCLEGESRPRKRRSQERLKRNSRISCLELHYWDRVRSQ